MHYENKYSSLMLEDVKKIPIVNLFIKTANDNLGVMGYTEHGLRHVGLISSISKSILRSLEHPKRIQELAAIAGYIHDIGNVISRHDHGQSAALIAMRILKDMGATPEEIALVISAIGSHEQEVGEPINSIAAALILADKSDVHKTRVRNKNISKYDIHDKVNYAVEKSFLDVNKKKKIISLHLNINTKVSQIIEYFEIFMPRVLMSRKAAHFLIVHLS
ncbi:MAG: HD domain-containing protein [Endomicrobium sp.]|jgi:metal-dependent HD superfamily phosphatase/phosphodiesterase|uniref:phosphohydrolase n=1 Tax=Candidatus Endomicrobiellum cubanum TaxID=3242325 RepID=UPI002832CF0C|nr:HD domain-containing protein [Endomicrobium sp.]